MKRVSINPYLANMRRLGAHFQAATSKPRLLAMLTVSIILGCFWTLEAQSGPAPAFYVSVERGRLSVNAENIVLRRLLEEIATQVDGQLRVSGSAVNSVISADLQNLPLEVGIKRLLRGISYVLEDSSPPNVWTLRILPSGPTQTEPNRDAVWDRPKTLGQKTTESTEAAQTNAHIFEPPAVVPGVEVKALPQLETLEQLLQTVQEVVTPAERDAAMNAFSGHGQEDITKLLSTTLVKGDPQIRDAALSVMQHMGDRAPHLLLAEMAVGDSDPGIRMRALQQLQDTAPPELVDSVRLSMERARLEPIPEPSEDWGDPAEKQK